MAETVNRFRRSVVRSNGKAVVHSSHWLLELSTTEHFLDATSLDQGSLLMPTGPDAGTGYIHNDNGHHSPSLRSGLDDRDLKCCMVTKAL